MAQLSSTNYNNPQFTYANATTDQFRVTDLQNLGQAVDNHDHTANNGLAVMRLGVGCALGSGSTTATGGLGYVAGHLVVGDGATAHTLVDLDSSQTISGAKTFSATPILTAAPTNTSGALGFSASQIVYGDGGAQHTVVSLDQVQVLTNKTLTTPTLTTATLSSHVNRSGSAPVFAAGAQAGSGPPSPVVTGGSTDLAGGCTFGTGTGAAAGEVVAITFNAPYTGSNPPVVWGTWANQASAGDLTGMFLTVNGTSGSWTGFSVKCTGTPASSQTNGHYAFWYGVIGGGG